MPTRDVAGFRAELDGRDEPFVGTEPWLSAAGGRAREFALEQAVSTSTVGTPAHPAPRSPALPPRRGPHGSVTVTEPSMKKRCGMQ